MALPVLTANSPSAGFIAWTSFSIRYGTVSVTIPAGNTNKRYAYWLWNAGAPASALQFADVLPALGPDDLLVFANRNGIPVNVTNTNVIEGSIIATDSIIGTSLSANTVAGDRMLADTITSREVSAGAITANELSISSFGGLQSVNGDMDDVDPTTKVPAGWTAGFERAGTAPTYAQETAAPLSGQTSVKITLAANSTEGMAATATPCKPGDIISFGVACRASVVGAPITIRAYFGTSPTFTRTQLVAATPDVPTNVVVYDVTSTGLVARSGQPTPVAGAGIAAAVEGWPAPVATSLYVVGQVKVPAGATYVRFVLASGLTASSPAHTMVWDSLDYAAIISSIKLADGAITARTISADALDGKVITGALIRTAATGARWELGAGQSWQGTTRTLLAYTGRPDETAPGALESDPGGALALRSSTFTGQPNYSYFKVGPSFSTGDTPRDGGAIFGYAGNMDLTVATTKPGPTSFIDSQMSFNIFSYDETGGGNPKANIYVNHTTAYDGDPNYDTGTYHQIEGENAFYQLRVDSNGQFDTSAGFTVNKDTMLWRVAYNAYNMQLDKTLGLTLTDNSGNAMLTSNNVSTKVAKLEFRDSTASAPKITAATYGRTSAAGNASGVATITHNLGAAPTMVIVKPEGTQAYDVVSSSYTATTFSVTVLARSSGAVAPNITLPVCWIAIR